MSRTTVEFTQNEDWYLWGNDALDDAFGASQARIAATLEEIERAADRALQVTTMEAFQSGFRDAIDGLRLATDAENRVVACVSSEALAHSPLVLRGLFDDLAACEGVKSVTVTIELCDGRKFSHSYPSEV